MVHFCKADKRIFIPVILFTMIISLISISITACTESQYDKARLKVVSMPYPTFAPFYIAEEERFFSEQGLEIEFVKFSTISHAIPLLAQGEIDAAAGPISASLINVISNSANIKIVAGREYLEHDETHNATKLMANKHLYDSGELDRLADMRGKKTAIPSIGSLQDYALSKMLEQVNLDLNDLEIVTMPPQDAIAALGSGSIDAATLGYTQGLEAREKNVAEEILPPEKILAGFQQGFIFYGPSLLDNSAAGEKFLKAYLKGIQQYMEGKTDRNIEIISKYIGWDRELLTDTIWNPIYPDARVDARSVMSFQSWLFERGLIETEISQTKLIDTSSLNKIIEENNFN